MALELHIASLNSLSESALRADGHVAFHNSILKQVHVPALRSPGALDRFPKSWLSGRAKARSTPMVCLQGPRSMQRKTQTIHIEEELR